MRSHAPSADVLLFAGSNAAAFRSALPFATRARWIHSLWTGVESIIGDEVRRHPAPLTNGRGVFRWPLADWVTAVMLHFAFDLGKVIRQQQQAMWKPVFGSMLEDRTLGIIGYGAIGSAAAQRARGFGMKIAALRRRPALFDADTLVDRTFAVNERKDLLQASDYLLLATPLTPETRGIIGAPELAVMKPSAVLINVGRGPVIDEPALLQALKSGTIRGAALDVFTTEPLPPDHEFWNLPNVLVSPHTADRVDGFLGPAFGCFIDNLARFQAGTPLLNIVDKSSGY